MSNLKKINFVKIQGGENEKKIRKSEKKYSI